MHQDWVDRNEFEMLVERIKAIEARQEKNSEKLDYFSEKMSHRDVLMAKVEVVLEKSLVAWEKMSDAVSGLTTTTSSLQSSLKEIEERLKSNTDAVLAIRGSYSSLEDRIEAVDKKGKIDVVEVIKKVFQDKLGAIFIGALATGGLALMVIDIVKTAIEIMKSN